MSEQVSILEERGARSSSHSHMHRPKDIQGNIHNALRTRLIDIGPPSPTYPFSFQTSWEDESDAPSAYVVWGGDIDVVASYKRSLEPLLMYVDVLYDNNTVASFSCPMTEGEVSRKPHLRGRCLPPAPRAPAAIPEKCPCVYSH